MGHFITSLAQKFIIKRSSQFLQKYTVILMIEHQIIDDLGWTVYFWTWFFNTMWIFVVIFGLKINIEWLIIIIKLCQILCLHTLWHLRHFRNSFVAWFFLRPLGIIWGAVKLFCVARFWNEVIFQIFVGKSGTFWWKWPYFIHW